MAALEDPASSIQESCRGLAAILDSAAAAVRGHDGSIRADCDAVRGPRPPPPLPSPCSRLGSELLSRAVADRRPGERTPEVQARVR